MKYLCYSLLCVLAFPFALHAQDSPVTPKDAVMESKINQAWAEVREHARLRDEGLATEADDPQHAYAWEFFRYFREHPETPTGKRAGITAFIMWGNLGASDKIDDALQHVPPDSELWSRMLIGIENAYLRSGRSEELVPLLHRLENEVTHPESRSDLLMRLARHYSRSGNKEKARAYYEDVVQRAANPFDVQKAKRALYEFSFLNIGQIAPDFTAQTIDGDTITLSDLRGKVVLLEFWSTTCGPCMPEISHLKALHERFAESDLAIIGIANDEDLETLKRFLKQRDMTWPQVQQLATFENYVLEQDEVLARYNVVSIPRSFVIDRDGTIAAKDLRGEALEETVAELIARREK